MECTYIGYIRMVKAYAKQAANFWVRAVIVESKYEN